MPHTQEALRPEAIAGRCRDTVTWSTYVFTASGHPVAQSVPTKGDIGSRGSVRGLLGGDSQVSMDANLVRRRQRIRRSRGAPRFASARTRWCLLRRRRPDRSAGLAEYSRHSGAGVARGWRSAYMECATAPGGPLALASFALNLSTPGKWLRLPRPARCHRSRAHSAPTIGACCG